MRMSIAPVSAALLLATTVASAVLARTFVENFTAMAAGGCIPDGTIVGTWQFVYNGYGCNAVVSPNRNAMLLEQPAAAATPGETHSSLVLGPAVAGDFTLTVSTVTTRQLRADAPNPWEVAWVLWHYTDNTHFYYFAAKPNGWELGKEDPGYPGSQRFLATGTTPAFPIGAWYRIRVSQAGETIRVFVNDLLIVSMNDRERAYSAGRVALYSEDAEAYFDNVGVTMAGQTKRQ
jgi:hypothetical protein